MQESEDSSVVAGHPGVLKVDDIRLAFNRESSAGE